MWECVQTASNKKVWLILLIIFSVFFVACIVILTLGYFNNKPGNIGGSVPKPVSSVPGEAPDVETPVDFNELKSANSDIYAWINVPGTNVNYPILQHESEQSYYLTHNVNKKSSKYGAIYTQSAFNKADFSDYNTLIYGHNMRNGTMFGTLKKFRDKKFFEKNQYIEIYMPGRILKYRIFGALVFDDRHIMMSFDFNDLADRQLYLDTIYALSRRTTSHFRDDITVGLDDKIITLSTCTSNDDERYLVEGVLVYDSKNP